MEDGASKASKQQKEEGFRKPSLSLRFTLHFATSHASLSSEQAKFFHIAHASLLPFPPIYSCLAY